MHTLNREYIFSTIVPFVKKIVGINDISLWKKRWAKRWGKFVYHQKYNTSDLISVMCEMGMKRGSTVCVHASMMQFYNFTDTANDIIQGIIDIIGEEGTLMMPAFPAIPKGMSYDNFIFDPIKDKTGAGYLAEVFRKWPNVKRSFNVHHSVCAIGRNADYLLRDHNKGTDCWDKNSPWYRMCELNGMVFNLGLPRNYIGTFHHCVESMLQSEYPYWAQFFDHTQTFRYKDADGSIHSYTGREGKLVRKTRERNIFKHLAPGDWEIRKISNLEIKVFNAKNVLKKMIELGREGISVYYVPTPSKFDFQR